MKLEFDSEKNKSNYAKHGVFLSDAVTFDWNTALCWVDERKVYNELRKSCIGYIADRLFVIVYTDRPTGRRVISLRKANLREAKRYAKA